MKKENRGMFRVKIEFEHDQITDTRVKGFDELDDLIFNVKKKLK